MNTIYLSIVCVLLGFFGKDAIYIFRNGIKKRKDFAQAKSDIHLLWIFEMERDKYQKILDIELKRETLDVVKITELKSFIAISCAKMKYYGESL